MNVIINSRTGELGTVDQWIQKFDKLWQNGKQSVEEFMDLLSDDVRLIAPGLNSTVGRENGLNAFKKTFEVLPDLQAKVLNWSFTDNVLFIEMQFSATIGKRSIKWYNVDRLIFEEGLAIERVAFFNPNKVRSAFLKNPAGWAQLFKGIKTGL